MDLLRSALYEQNCELLKNISEDFFPKMIDEQYEFIEKYNKINYTFLLPNNRDPKPSYEKRIIKLSK
jgi:hypothetical protein